MSIEPFLVERQRLVLYVVVGLSQFHLTYQQYQAYWWVLEYIQTMLEAATNKEKIEKLKGLLRDNSSPPKQQQRDYNNYSKTAQRSHQPSLIPLEHRYLEVQEKINRRVQEEWRIYQGVLGELDQLQQQARSAKKEIDRSKHITDQRALLFQRTMNDQISQQIEQIRAIRKQLIQSIQKKYKTIKTQTMSILGSQFQNGWDEARDEILNQIEDIRSSMESEEGARDEIVTFMVNNFGEEILKAEQMVQKEKEERLESHKKILASISILEEEVANSIVGEKRESMTSIHGLEGLLEELCFKIESHVLR